MKQDTNRLRAPVPAVEPPKDRRRLMFTGDISREIFHGRKSLWWIRTNLAPTKKIRLGRDAAWYEADVHDWLRSQMTEEG